MSRTLTSRLAAQAFCRASSTPKAFIPTIGARAFSQTNSRRDDTSKDSKPSSNALLKDLYGDDAPKASTPAPERNNMSSLTSSSLFQQPRSSGSSLDTSVLRGGSPSATAAKAQETEIEPYHLHVYSHKHNTHVTCTRPNREPIISLSCGNLGYRKSRRGTFDSAYSLIKYLIERLIHNGVTPKIKRLEVVLRGFGQGREAALKVLMSPEGRILRDKIVRVSDSTRIKFGGTRSKAPRRL